MEPDPSPQPSVVQITLVGDRWLGYRSYGPSGAAAVTVPSGATVEFRNGTSGDAARIVSTSAPSGGQEFDSGDLAPGGRFRFVPDVSGTWEFVDEFSDANGSVTVR